MLYYNINEGWNGSGGYIAGFFYQVDLTNNGLPILNIDTYPGVYYKNPNSGNVYKRMDDTYGTMVHEYQHLINYSNTSGMNSWLNECFSAAAEEICYPGSSVVGRIQSWEDYYYSDNNDWLNPPKEFQYNSSYSLHKGYSMYAWDNDLDDVLVLYAQVSLFAQYLYTRFGNSIYRQISGKYSSSETTAITNATGVSCADLVRDFRVAVTANTTLYALFTRMEGTGELIYRLVNDNLSDWTGNYVITYAKDTNMLVLKTANKDQRIESASAGQSVAYANTGITLDGEVLRNVGSDYVFALAQNGDYYTIKNDGTGYWIGTQSTYLHNMASYQSEYSDWNVEYDLYNICMKVSNVASTNYTYLVKGSNSYFVVNTGYTTNKTQFWKEEVEGITYYNTNPAAAHTHSYGEWTPNNDGTHSCTCAECGNVVTENCTYTDVVTAPTQTEQGYTTHTCTVCGYSYTDSYTAALGYTVSFSVSAGVTAPAAVNCQANASITLPSAGAPEGYTFLGWVAETVNNVSEQPAYLSGSYTATADITLYALYTRTTTEAGGFELVTSEPASWEGSYVITHGKTAEGMQVLKGIAGTKKYESKTAGGSGALSDTGMTLSDGVLTNAGSAYIFTVTAANGKYRIQNAATGTYLANKGGYLYSYKTDAVNYCRWTFAIADETVRATNGATRTRPYLMFSSNNYFMVGRSADAELCFWKMTAGAEITVYTTVID